MEIAKKMTEKIREWVARQDRKKLIENTAVVIIIGVIIIIAGSTLFGHKDNRKDNSVPETAATDNNAFGPTPEIRMMRKTSKPGCKRYHRSGSRKVDVMVNTCHK